jgi:RHS repeat-associated protein
MYDLAGQVIRLTNLQADGTTLSSFTYRYDPAGNRLRVIEASGDVVTWTYDGAYRLRSERRTGAAAYSVTHNYDPAGNRVFRTDGGIVTTYVYDAGNQLNQQLDGSGTTTFLYDPNGNTLARVPPTLARVTNSWDMDNRLARVVLPSGVRNTFQYNADGKRVQIADSTGTRYLVWDNQNVATETDATGVPLASYTSAPATYGLLLSQLRGSLKSWFHYDALGSTDHLTRDNDGSSTDAYIYDGFGATRMSSGTTVNPFRYLGQLGYYANPDIGLYLLRARMYDPGLGRFVNPDPAGLSGGLNLYGYVDNNPTNRIDPSGLKALCCCIKTAHWKPGLLCQLWFSETCLVFDSTSCGDQREADWKEKCDPKSACGMKFAPPLPPPPGPPKQGGPCNYGPPPVGTMGLTWQRRCVCQCAGNSKGMNCIRGCMQCSFDSGAPKEKPTAEDFCRDACGLSGKELARLNCCLTQDYNHGGCAGTFFEGPPADPNPDNPACTGMPIP